VAVTHSCPLPKCNYYKRFFNLKLWLWPLNLHFLIFSFSHVSPPSPPNSSHNLYHSVFSPFFILFYFFIFFIWISCESWHCCFIWTVLLQALTKGQIFDTCISVTSISVLKRLAVVLSTKKCSIQIDKSFGAETHVTEIQPVSKIWP